jgi:ABC-type polysaccharide/polyol phosphate transport system ATPase subunit
LGCAISEIESDIGRVAGPAGVEHQLDVMLDDVPAAVAVKLALTVALELARPALLLIDLMPTITDTSFRDWLTHWTWQLRSAGGAIVQVVFDAEQLFGPADRIVWIGDRELMANGYGASVFEARWRRQLGLLPGHRGSGALVPLGTRP